MKGEDSDEMNEEEMSEIPELEIIEQTDRFPSSGNISNPNFEGMQVQPSLSANSQAESEVISLVKKLEKVSIQEKKRRKVVVVKIPTWDNFFELSKMIEQRKKEEAIYQEKIIEQTKLVETVKGWLEMQIEQNREELRKSTLLRRKRPECKAKQIVGFYKPKGIVYVIISLEEKEQTNTIFNLRHAKQEFAIKLQAFFEECVRNCVLKLRDEPSGEQQRDYVDSLFGNRWALKHRGKGIFSGSTQVIQRELPLFKVEINNLPVAQKWVSQEQQQAMSPS